MFFLNVFFLREYLLSESLSRRLDAKFALQTFVLPQTPSPNLFMKKVWLKSLFCLTNKALLNCFFFQDVATRGHLRTASSHFYFTFV